MVIAALDVACFVQPSPMPWGPIVPFEASLCGWPKADCRPSFVVFGLKLGLLDRLLRCPIINSVGLRILALGISGPVISWSVIYLVLRAFTVLDVCVVSFLAEISWLLIGVNCANRIAHNRPPLPDSIPESKR